MAAHALLSPSSAYRWLVCTPSARLTELMPEQRRKGGFDHALNGTTAHEYAEAQLRRYYKQITAAEYNEIVNRIKETEFYSDEFESYVAEYVLFVRSQIGPSDSPYFEIRVDFSRWVPNGSGTSDVIIIQGDTIHVVDLKFGTMRVDAEGNPQMRLYALGAYEKFREQHPGLKHVKCTIMQPRIGNISTEELSLDDLVAWADNEVAPQAIKADRGEGEFVAGDHCGFCKAKAQCRARAEFANIDAARDFQKPSLLSEQELAETLRKAPLMKAWLKDVEEYSLDRAVNGNVPIGFALGKTVTKRKIDDVEKAKELLLDAGVDPELILEEPSLKSVAQLEKAVGKDRVQEIIGSLIVKPEGEPKLVENKANEDFA